MRPLLAALPLWFACVSQPAGPEPAGPFPVTEHDTWSVRQDGREVGRIVLQQIEHPRQQLRFYRVENVHRQRVGSIDLSGRVYRLVPFRDQEQFLGIHAMPEAARLLLELDAPVTIVGAREASLDQQR